MAINIIRVPAFNDNYIWLFHQEASNQAFVVDPGDPTVVEQALASQQLELGGILLTHHHFDHTGGVESLTKDRNIPVYAGSSSQVPGVTEKLNDGQILSLPGDMAFKVIDVPGHTLDHIAFYNDAEGILFSGDTLFVGGCGRLFEGTAHQMLESLSKLASLPGDTRVYCAHEYTLANLAFAKAVEPTNQAINDKIRDCEQLRQSGKATVPSTIADELVTNPFLRSEEPEVMQQAKLRSAKDSLKTAEVFAEIRGWKDQF